MLAVLFVGVLLAALDIAIVGPALPAIRGTFAVAPRWLPAVFSVYVLFYLVGTPLLAKRSDRIGASPRVSRKSRGFRARLVGCRGGVVFSGAPARPRDSSVRRRRPLAGRRSRHRRDGAARATRPHARAHRCGVRRRLSARPAAGRTASRLELAVAVRRQRPRRVGSHGGSCAPVAASGRRGRAAFRCLGQRAARRRAGGAP